MTRLTAVLVITTLLCLLILAAVWFAAPGLLARKAAHRVTASGPSILLDGKPIEARTDLFYSHTAGRRVTQRQLRMAFRGAESTLETQLGRPPTVTAIHTENSARLLATWTAPNAIIELTTGTTGDDEFTTLTIDVRQPNPATSPGIPASLDDVTTIYGH